VAKKAANTFATAFLKQKEFLRIPPDRVIELGAEVEI
jgi:K+ transporter